MSGLRAETFAERLKAQFEKAGVCTTQKLTYAPHGTLSHPLQHQIAAICRFAVQHIIISLPRYGLGRAAGCARQNLRYEENRYVVTEVSLNTVDENAIKNRILHAVWDLWTSHAEAIYRAMYGAFARAAADITPQIAAQLYAEQYPMLGYPTLENPTQ